MMTDKDLPLQLGSERFWPVTGDFPEEMEKAGRILRAFTGELVRSMLLYTSLHTFNTQWKVFLRLSRNLYPGQHHRMAV
jgi:hypothetical protein